MTREEAIEILWQYDVNFEPHPAEKVMQALDMAIEALSAEAVEVVRCKDCKYYHADKMYSYCSIINVKGRSPKQIDFCSYGERKGGKNHD